MAKLNERGHEVLDSTPLRLPIGFKRPETLAEQVQRLVRTHLSQVAEAEGYETFEEADDFDIPEDDHMVPSPYEMEFDPVLGREVSAEMILEQREKLYRNAKPVEDEPAQAGLDAQASPAPAEEAIARAKLAATEDPS